MAQRTFDEKVLMHLYTPVVAGDPLEYEDDQNDDPDDDDVLDSPLEDEDDDGDVLDSPLEDEDDD